ncbi:MAG: sulfotransferase [Planctomycetota bacterium]
MQGVSLGVLSKPSKSPLLHIGVRKAASTFLQSWFANHDGVSYTTRRDLVEEALRRVLPADVLSEVLGESRVNRAYRPRRESGRTPVISNEHFAMFAYGTELMTPDQILGVLKAGRDVLAETYPDARILMVTRAPAKWVVSAYNQHIRWPSRTSSFPAFVRKHVHYFRVNLNYRLIRDLYAEAFGADRVLVLPQEMLRDNQAGFLGAIESFAGIEGEVEEAFDFLPKNASFSDAETEKLRMLRTVLRTLESGSPRRSELNEFREKVLAGQRDIDQFLGDAVACYATNPNPQVERVLRVMFRGLPEPSAKALDRTVPADLLAEFAEGCQFLTDRPEYQLYARSYFGEAAQVADVTADAAS